MDVRLKTMPRVWKEMIESLREHLQVSVGYVEKQYLRMLYLNHKHAEKIKRIETEYESSESNQPQDFDTHRFAEWAKIIKVLDDTPKDSTVLPPSREDTESAVEVSRQQETDTPVIPAVPANPANPAIPAIPAIPLPHQIEVGAEKEKPSSTSSSADGNSKVETILDAFSVDHDIFWFR